MTSSVVSSQPSTGRASVAWRAGGPSRIVALSPLWVLIVSWIAAPTYFGPLGGEYPNILGLNLGVIVQGLALLWMLIGLRLLWATPSRLVEALAYTLFTLRRRCSCCSRRPLSC